MLFDRGEVRKNDKKLMVCFEIQVGDDSVLHFSQRFCDLKSDALFPLTNQ